MMRKKQIMFIAEVSIFAALGLVFDFLAGLYSGVIWPNGGSITLAFVPIFIMGYRNGLKGGLLTGLLVGTIQLFWSGYMLNFFQVVLDYVLPNVVLGLVGIVSKQVIGEKSIKQALFVAVSILVVCFIRFASLTISGMVYWETGFWASVVYNGGYTLISTIACLIVTVLIINRIPKLDY